VDLLWSCSDPSRGSTKTASFCQRISATPELPQSPFVCSGCCSYHPNMSEQQLSQSSPLSSTQLMSQLRAERPRVSTSALPAMFICIHNCKYTYLLTCFVGVRKCSLGSRLFLRRNVCTAPPHGDFSDPSHLLWLETLSYITQAEWPTALTAL
jgi:hypothetical protein